MRKKGSHYSNDEKYHFIRLYHESGMSKRSFCKLHGISRAYQLRYWLNQGLKNEVDYYISTINKELSTDNGYKRKNCLAKSGKNNR